MQQKRKRILPLLLVLVFLAAAVAIGGVMMLDLPAPSQPVEKEISPPSAP
ncbi:MAG: hypothetical protein SFT92_06395 [Rickettsiales bacterium]|nr:hypothetical protein [Rickettsiales bacterium]